MAARAASGALEGDGCEIGEMFLIKGAKVAADALGAGAEWGVSRGSERRG